MWNWFSFKAKINLSIRILMQNLINSVVFLTMYITVKVAEITFELQEAKACHSSYLLPVTSPLLTKKRKSSKSNSTMWTTDQWCVLPCFVYMNLFRIKLSSSWLPCYFSHLFCQTSFGGLLGYQTIGVDL